MCFLTTASVPTVQEHSLVALFVVWVTYLLQKYCHKGAIITKI